MFVRVRYWTTHPGEWDRFVSRLEHEGLQAMRASDGFDRLIINGDPMSNTVVTVSFWESESKERAYEVDKAPAFQVVVKDLIAAVPETFAYPVVGDHSA